MEMQKVKPIDPNSLFPDDEEEKVRAEFHAFKAMAPVGYVEGMEDLGIDKEWDSKLRAYPAIQIAEAIALKSVPSNAQPAIKSLFKELDGQPVKTFNTIMMSLSSALVNIDSTVKVLSAADATLSVLGEIPTQALSNHLVSRKKDAVKPVSFYELWYDFVGAHLSVSIEKDGTYIWFFKTGKLRLPHWLSVTDDNLRDMAEMLSGVHNTVYIYTPQYIDQFVQYAVAAHNLTVQENGEILVTRRTTPYKWPNNTILQGDLPRANIEDALIRPFINLLKGIKLDGVSTKNAYNYIVKLASIANYNTPGIFDALNIPAYIKVIQGKVMPGLREMIKRIQETLAANVMAFATEQLEVDVFSYRADRLKKSRQLRATAHLDHVTDWAMYQSPGISSPYVNFSKNQKVLEICEEFTGSVPKFAIGVDTPEVAKYLTASGVKDCYDITPKLGVHELNIFSVQAHKLMKGADVFVDVYLPEIQYKGKSEYDRGMMVLDAVMDAHPRSGVIKLFLPEAAPVVKSMTKGLKHLLCNYAIKVQKVHKYHNNEYHLFFRPTTAVPSVTKDRFIPYYGAIKSLCYVALLADDVRMLATLSTIRDLPRGVQPPLPKKDMMPYFRASYTQKTGGVAEVVGALEKFDNLDEELALYGGDDDIANFRTFVRDPVREAESLFESGDSDDEVPIPGVITGGAPSTSGVRPEAP